MAIKLLDYDNIWTTILKLGKEASHRQVAVSYLGTGARELLPLNKGDILIVNMSEGIIKNGLTNPFEIYYYYKKGVRIFNVSNLHSKVYIFDNKVIISSSNISYNSKDRLIETGILCSDKEVISQAKGLIMDLQGEPVTPEYIKHCKKIYKPPFFENNGKKKKGKLSPQHPPLWLLSLEYTEYNDYEKRLDKQESKEASKEIKNKKKYEVTSMKYGVKNNFTKSVKKNDLVIQVVQDGRGIDLIETSRVVRISPYSINGVKMKLIYLEEPKADSLYNWSPFRAFVKRNGLGITSNSTREIKSAELKHKILGYFI